MDIEELRIRVREINKGLNNPYEFGEGYKRCKKFIQKNSKHFSKSLFNSFLYSFISLLRKIVLFIVLDK